MYVFILKQVPYYEHDFGHGYLIQYVYVFLVGSWKAQRQPWGWSRDYPGKLDSLDPFFSKYHGYSIDQGKLLERPRTKPKKASAVPDEDLRRMRIRRLNLREAVNEMTKMTGEN